MTITAFLSPLPLLRPTPSPKTTSRPPVCTASPPTAATLPTHPDIKRLEPSTRFHQIVIHNDIVYLSGQVARNTDGTPYNETHAVLQKIDALLTKAGTSKSRLLSATVYLADISGAAEMNRAWDEWVDHANKPARACVQAQMVDPSIGVEITVTAALPPRGGVVRTDAAAQAVGPYNQAVVVDDGSMYVSGCIGLTTEGVLVEGVEEQTKQALRNLKAILEGGGGKVGDVVKTTVLLREMKDFAAVNALYERFWEGGRVPARSCFAARELPKGALVEIEAVACLPRV